MCRLRSCERVLVHDQRRRLPRGDVQLESMHDHDDHHPGQSLQDHARLRWRVLAGRVQLQREVQRLVRGAGWLRQRMSQHLQLEHARLQSQQPPLRGQAHGRRSLRVLHRLGFVRAEPRLHASHLRLELLLRRRDQGWRLYAPGHGLLRHGVRRPMQGREPSLPVADQLCGDGQRRRLVRSGYLLRPDDIAPKRVKRSTPTAQPRR